MGARYLHLVVARDYWLPFGCSEESAYSESGVELSMLAVA